MIENPKVIIQAAAYEYPALRPVVFGLLDAFLPARIRPGTRVVVKPNLLAPAGPDKAIVTHPLIVRAVVEYCLEKGGRVQVSDSQAMGRFDRVVRESGLEAALKGLDVRCLEFKESVVVDVGEPFKRIEIARDAIEADLLINLPKLKTHTQMLMTLGVKNLFGCVVGLKKPEWHFRTGINRELFAALLVNIHHALKPAVTLLDGILAMEGQGPGRSGTPREIGILTASSDAYALDSVICKMIGLPSDSVYTNKAARKMGLLPGEIEVIGPAPQVRDFRLPEITPIVFGPKALHGLMRRHLVQRPLADDSCRQCGECWRYCPAGAMSRGSRGIRIDYEKCIRCYCCIEVCPEGALRAAEPFLGKAIRKFRR